MGLREVFKKVKENTDPSIWPPATGESLEKAKGQAAFVLEGYNGYTLSIDQFSNFCSAIVSIVGAKIDVNGREFVSTPIELDEATSVVVSGKLYPLIRKIYPDVFVQQIGEPREAIIHAFDRLNLLSEVIDEVHHSIVDRYGYEIKPKKKGQFSIAIPGAATGMFMGDLLKAAISSRESS